jgi:hypothetical protein
MDSGLTSRTPSGLFPSHRPTRPSYREPHPVRFPAVLAGAGAATAWLLLVGMFAGSARGYAWLTLTAGALASLVAAGLGRYGDRGAAVGIALATAVGVSVSMGLVLSRWITAGWPLW